MWDLSQLAASYIALVYMCVWSVSSLHCVDL